MQHYWDEQAPASMHALVQGREHSHPAQQTQQAEHQDRLQPPALASVSSRRWHMRYLPKTSHPICSPWPRSWGAWRWRYASIKHNKPPQRPCKPPCPASGSSRLWQIQQAPKTSHFTCSLQPWCLCPLDAGQTQQ